MNLDHSVIVIKDDGTRVLTNVIEPGDNIEGNVSYEDIAKRLETPEDYARGPVRTDADLSVQESVPTVVVPPEEGTVENNTAKPEGDANKGAWYTYARSLGYTGDYEDATKAALQKWVAERA